MEHFSNILLAVKCRNTGKNEAAVDDSLQFAYLTAYLHIWILHTIFFLRNVFIVFIDFCLENKVMLAGRFPCMVTDF